ncbi:MAG: hypothetical protein WC695_04270 [Candidatus Omnitrophota bacterium]
MISYTSQRHKPPAFHLFGSRKFLLFHGNLGRTVAISFLSHIALFGLFSFSFGTRMPDTWRPDVSFLGSILLPTDVAIPGNHPQTGIIESIFSKKTASGFLKAQPGSFLTQPAYEPKPALAHQLSLKKCSFSYHAAAKTGRHILKDHDIMFYPLLPQHFMLYFQDRQSAHMELLCKAGKVQKPSSIIIKRKVSSGNLEVDLLTMRYIGHYLFIQQRHFIEDTWQTIKIDLSAETK